MDTNAFSKLTVPFYKSVAQVLDELRKQDMARIDADLLNLKRQTLAEKRDQFLAAAKSAAQQEKARLEQDMASRGSAASTVLQDMVRTVERDWADQTELCVREYNRAIEEIATLERRIGKQSRPWWKRLLRLR